MFLNPKYFTHCCAENHIDWMKTNKKFRKNSVFNASEFEQGKGAFTDYVNMVLAFFDHIPTLIYINILCTKISLLLTTYPPLCVHVILKLP